MRAVAVDRAVLELALEALEMFENCDAFIPSLKKLSQDDAEQEEERRAVVYAHVGKAIPALRAALDQPLEQEGGDRDE